MPTMTGARFLAETVHGYGLTHLFFMPYIAPRALMEMEKLGIRRIQTHGEKAAAYMADAYARVRRGPASVWPNRWGRSTWPPGCRMPISLAHQ
ncbi:MAG: thiamine pyrophosphate-binding protein [Caldilineaceae bacterium]